MQRNRLLLIGAALAAVIVLFVILRPGGGDDDDAAATTAQTTTEAATTAEQTTTEETTTEETTTEATTTEAAPPPPPPPAPEVTTMTITIVDGQPVDGIVRQTVKQGEKVRIVVRADVEDEVHLHGYDIMRDVAPGKPAQLAFTADVAGQFEIELEDRGLQIGELEVEP